MVAVVKIPVISLNFFYDQLAMFSDWIHLRVGMNLVCPLQSRSIGSTLGLWCKLSLFIPPRKKVFQVQMNRLFASTCPEPVVTVSLHIVLPTVFTVANVQLIGAFCNQLASPIWS
ncbi:uncharacterized protein LOC131156712 isoform X2 [Malania oleifera]|uniref:uncharacterized protein LOC131156712 isoform X2 n=1 Tax=Malania oleifera TaxID=397392 RepID=UPI0025AD9FD1|nr:uncharacterized protein LOC131156712 isoform X2 [Malania oleifera]